MINEHRNMVFSLSVCPRCEELKDYLRELGVDFYEKDLNDNKVQALLMEEGLYLKEAPCLLHEGLISTIFKSSDLFINGKLDKQFVKDIVYHKYDCDERYAKRLFIDHFLATFW